MPETFDFGKALEVLRSGGSVARRDWNGPDQRITLQSPDEHSKMTRPYLYITTKRGDRIPWLASQTDILMDDWYAVAA